MTATTWDFDLAHSSVNFHGRFGTLAGSLVLDEQDITKSRVEVTIEAASVDTKEEKRDAHLRSAEFFDAEKFPQLTFKSTAVKKVSDEDIEVAGDLTIRGETKPITLKVETSGQVKDPWGGTRTGFSAKATISRKEFGLHWNALLETGGVVVGDKIEITLEIEAVKKADSQAA